MVLSPELRKMKDCAWELNQEISLKLGNQGITSELNSCLNSQVTSRKYIENIS